MTDQKNGQEYLSFVLEKLQARLAEISQSLLDGQKEIENMHDYYWQNYTEMDQYGYEDYDNQQALLHQVNANQEQLLLRSRFRKMLDSPFFGRVDFCYDGDDEPEIFYIGIGNFAERPGELPLIYDWRSPVSGLFYDFDRGPASYLAPGGEMTGEICSKWQYKIRDGKMIYGFESDVKIDDDILKAELGSNGEVQLKNIIRTIQKEQNAIIRNTKDRILVIQGAAGSGKVVDGIDELSDGAKELADGTKKFEEEGTSKLKSTFEDDLGDVLDRIQALNSDKCAYTSYSGKANGMDGSVKFIIETAAIEAAEE